MYAVLAGLPNGRQRLYAGPSCSNRARRSDEATRVPVDQKLVFAGCVLQTVSTFAPGHTGHVYALAFTFFGRRNALCN
jgi:hypothetical protein